jgi:iron(III) transport system ATP-binding protein
VVDGRALLEGEGWRLWGAARGALKTGDAATGIIRLERTRIADAAGDNRLRTELVTGMFLGDRKENLFKLGAIRLRCYGTPPVAVGEGDCYLELPQDDFWVFASPGAAA